MPGTMGYEGCQIESLVHGAAVSLKRATGWITYLLSCFWILTALVVNDCLGHMLGDQLLLRAARQTEASSAPGIQLRLGRETSSTILLENIQEIGNTCNTSYRRINRNWHCLCLSGQRRCSPPLALVLRYKPLRPSRRLATWEADMICIKPKRKAQRRR